MIKVLLVVAAIVDVALAGLLIAVSGFMFGAGPESMHAGPGFMAFYWAAVIACVAAPVVGFIFNRRGKTTAGLVVGWVPPAGALLALAIPPPY